MRASVKIINKQSTLSVDGEGADDAICNCVNRQKNTSTVTILLLVFYASNTGLRLKWNFYFKWNKYGDSGTNFYV